MNTVPIKFNAHQYEWDIKYVSEKEWIERMTNCLAFIKDNFSLDELEQLVNYKIYQQRNNS